MTYYEQRNYARALHFSRLAHEEEPDCPLVLWDLACALNATGQIKESLDIFRKLFDKGAYSIAADKHGEGFR